MSPAAGSARTNTRGVTSDDVRGVTQRVGAGDALGVPQGAAGAEVLCLQGACAGYGQGRRYRQVLFDVDLSVRSGQVVGVIGPNGAGKSTLVGVLSRMLPLAAGRATLDARPLERYGRRDLARRLAVVQQAARLPEGYLVHEVVSMGRTPYVGLWRGASRDDEAEIERAMRETGVWELSERPVERLSGGEQQRVVLARALAQRPHVLLLDEPTSHLDLRYQTEVLVALRAAARHGVGVLLVLHDLNLAARVCDRITLLSDGRVDAEGSAAEVLSQRRLERVYRTGVEVFSTPRGPVVAPRLR